LVLEKMPRRNFSFPVLRSNMVAASGESTTPNRLWG